MFSTSGDIQYIGVFITSGGVQYIGPEYHEYIRGVKYIVGYHECIGEGDIMNTLGDIMIHVGDTMITLGDVQYIREYHEYIRVFNRN